MRARQTTTVSAALAAARTRAGAPIFIGEAKLYCEEQSCSVRQVVVELKEHNGLTPAPFGCPVCRQPLNLHRVLTREEKHAQDERLARCSVNAQRYQRDHPDELGFVPLSGLPDEHLP
jgi:hypothetical protein